MFWILLIAAVMLVVSGLRNIPKEKRARVMRLGRWKVISPGIFFILPFIDKFERISIERFSVSLPPQGGITSDEVPIQLQASLKAIVLDPSAALSVRDWRVSLMSQLQDLMKEELENFDFTILNADFSTWVESLRKQMKKKAGEIGAELESLEISNLSPRELPPK